MFLHTFQNITHLLGPKKLATFGGKGEGRSECHFLEQGRRDKCINISQHSPSQFRDGTRLRGLRGRNGPRDVRTPHHRGEDPVLEQLQQEGHYELPRVSCEGCQHFQDTL